MSPRSLVIHGAAISNQTGTITFNVSETTDVHTSSTVVGVGAAHIVSSGWRVCITTFNIQH